ncbi:hypothetical protein JKA74_09500 [Marivirga sp. S37H4]|uniref:Outer membrane protein beta-barrel domain-containing protein n=1 Tax=Marivirga aurantiaca TaxID=2802615 RepID=A0A934WY35_9BACT|nr:hypothetical protein [Marivirga aurantiaca]MBK6265274.1 hypothetical protein [Marivirga aurantiaca]
MKILSISIIIWLAALSCFAQENTKNHSVSLNLGITTLTRQDLTFSPLIHKDFSLLNLGIDYDRQAKVFQRVSFRYGNFNPMSTDPYDFSVHGETKTAYPHSFNLIDIDYLIGKKIKESEKSILTVGGLLLMDIQALNYVYGRIGNFGYYSATSLGMFGKYQFTINDNSNLTTSLKLPLVAWLARSPYYVNDDEFIENTSSHSGFKTFMAFMGDGNLTTLNKWQSFDLDIKYMYSLNEKWQLGAAYLFEFIHSSQARNLLSYRNSINLSANLKF